MKDKSSTNQKSKTNRNGRSFKNNGRQGNYSDRGRSGQTDTVRDRNGRLNGNDPAWYKVNDQIAHDIGSFSFGNPTGAPFTLEPSTVIQAHTSYTSAVPGTYSIYSIPAIGEASSETSAINIAMQSMFRNLRKGNTASQAYDPADVMMYFTAIDSAYIWFAVLTRLYGLGRTYTYYNRYFADGVTLAQGFDPSVLSELAWLRGYINQLSVKLNQFAVPNSLNYFKRHYWLYSNAWRDGETTKSQIYLHVPQALYVYDELSGPGRCVLQDVFGTVDQGNGCAPTTALRTFDIVRITNMLLDPLVKSQDIGLISGDIVKFWGDQLFQVRIISDDMTVMPEYNKEVLSQIHNITYTGSGLLDGPSLNAAFGYGTATIQQQTGVNSGYLTCTPHFRGTNGSMYFKIVDFEDTISPTPDQVLVATRGTTISTVEYADATNDAYLLKAKAYGSELYLYYVVGTWAPNQLTPYFVFYYHGERTSPSAASVINIMQRITPFHMRPMYYRVDTTAPHSLVGIFGEYENYRIFTTNDLITIHDGAILAMFALKDTLT